LQFVSYNKETDTYGTVSFEHEVMFRHFEPPVLDLQNVKRFDNFEPDAWYKISSIKFMEAISSATSPCTANTILTLTGIVGTFNTGEIVTSSGGTSGTVMSFTGTTLNLYISSGSMSAGETITGPSGSATIA
jgi:hypothetical protein